MATFNNGYSQLTMQVLPDNNSSKMSCSRLSDALKDIEQAQSQLVALQTLLDSALYLDEDEYSNAQPVSQYNVTLQSQQAKIQELENEVRLKVAKLDESNRLRAALEQRVSDLLYELDNNKNVFALHYEELLKKDAEIDQLQNIVATLSLSES